MTMEQESKQASDYFPQMEESVHPIVDLTVKNYYFVGDGDSYEKHFFIIHVNAGSTHYNVDRSYVDFVEFDRRVRKIYPDSSIPALPLEATFRLQQLITREATLLLETKKRGGGVLGMAFGAANAAANRKSITGDFSTLPSDVRKTAAKNLFRIPAHSTEVMKSCEEQLTYYLSDICCHHELLSSNILQLFLDEEITTMFSDKIPPTLTVYDLLLIKSTTNNCVVHRIEEQLFKVPASSVIVWKFSTTQFDIGFSVEVEGITRLPLTRYNAHQEAICGGLEVNMSTTVKLIWNNTYAKLHTKNLMWVVRIMSKEQYVEAKTQAAECYREKKRFERQRIAFRLAVFHQSSMISRVIHGDVTEEDYSEEDTMLRQMNFSKLATLQQSNEILMRDLKTAEAQLKDLQLQSKRSTTSVAPVFETATAISSSNDVVIGLTSEEERALRHEIDELKLENNDLHNALQEADDLIHEKDIKILELQDLVAASGGQSQDNERLHTLLDEVAELSDHMKQQLEDFKKEYLQSTNDLQAKEREFRDIISSSGASGSGSEQSKSDGLKLLVSDILADIHKKNDEWYELVMHLGEIGEHIESLAEL